MGKVRLDKYLADQREGARSEVKEQIRRGHISVNGIVIRKSEYKVDPEQDVVAVDGRQLEYMEFEYIMLHKPAGVVTAVSDKRDKTVMDLLMDTRCKNLFPVGRLDKDTEGLLLITNDGPLSHQLLSPKKHVDKTYYARIKGRVTKEDQEAFLEGVRIGREEVTLPARLNILTSDEVSEIELTLQEGKFHQVKRMFEAVGKKVLYLKRLSMGSLWLDEELEKGSFRHLTKEEIRELKGENVKDVK